jgi:hypothetical protein
LFSASLSKRPLAVSSSPILRTCPRFPGERSAHRATDFLQKSFGWRLLPLVLWALQAADCAVGLVYHIVVILELISMVLLSENILFLYSNQNYKNMPMNPYSLHF